MPLSEYSIYEFILNKYKNPQRMDPFFITTTEIVRHFEVSRQFVGAMLRILIKKGKIIKIGSTKKAKFTLSLHDIMNQNRI